MARWIIWVVLVVCTARIAAAEFVDGEVRAHLRSGPGLEYRILKNLPAGSAVRALERDGDWVRVRHADVEGWIPSDYVSADPPASTQLPQLREKLVAAEARISELDQKLVAQSAELVELAELRERNRVLEVDASNASANARWKALTAGAGIVLVGILIGLIAPRGGGTRSKLKL